MSDYKEISPEDELLKKQAELDARENALNKKEKELNALDKKITNTKYNLYSHINATKDTMNKVVAGIAIVLIIAIIVAIATRG